MARPKVLITPWRRRLKTFLGEKTDLYTLAPAYADGVRRAGGLPIIAAHLDDEELAELLDTVDAVLISGGQDMDPASYGAENESSWGMRPESDAFDTAVVHGAIERGLPMLGICRGVQVLNVALGGALRQEVLGDGNTAHPTYSEMGEEFAAHRHEVEFADGCRLAAIYGTGSLEVNSLHHQAVGDVAEGLTVTARAGDGGIEAVEGDEIDAVAVQWHPEMTPGEGGDALFADLVVRATARATISR